MVRLRASGPKCARQTTDNCIRANLAHPVQAGGADRRWLYRFSGESGSQGSIIVSAASHLTARQRSELEFHRAHADAHREEEHRPVALDILATGPRRPWNAYWSMYDRILAAEPAGKRVLVPGCGFGEDAIRLALLGAEVSAFDLSPESLEIARSRARHAGVDIAFSAMPAEDMSAYADASFDLVILSTSCTMSISLQRSARLPALSGRAARSSVTNCSPIRGFSNCARAQWSKNWPTP